jgi:chromosome segregation ATPase
MQISDNSNPQTLATSAKTSKLSKTPKNSKPSKTTKKIIKIQIDTSKCDETHCNNLIDECNCKIRTTSCDECEKKLINCICNGCPIECPRCNKKVEGCNCTHYESDSESEEEEINDEDEEQFLEPDDDWDYCDFENRYRELLFYYKSLKEENQGAHEEINGLKFRLEQATADALKLNTANIAQDDKIDNLEIDLIFSKKEINKLKRKLKNEEKDNQQLIEERDQLLEKRDDLQNELELSQLTNENLNNEIKDLKIYSNDNEENFFKVNEENKELQDTITGLQLEKEIICKQNEDLNEKLRNLRENHNRWTATRINNSKDQEKKIEDLEDKNQELKNRIEKLEYNLDIEYKKSFYGGSEKTLNLEKIKRLEDLIREKDDSNQELKRKLSDVDIERCNYKSELECLRVDLKEITTKYNQIDSDNSDYIHELQDLKVAFKEMKEKNIKLNEGMGVFGRQILDLEIKIKKLNIMMEEYEGIGVISSSMKWTIQYKLETFINPDFKPTVDYPRHHINLGNGEFY